MDMWTIFSIAVAAIVIALVLAYLLKSRLSDDDVWQELVDADTPAENAESYARSHSEPTSFTAAPELARPGVTTMRSTNSNLPSSRDVDLRRSSRVDNPVALLVLGTNRRGESFQERTSAVSFNLHGCRYSSRHEYLPESYVTLQVTGTDGAGALPVRARVRSIVSAQSSRELCQIGVELETPANIWGIATPPEDWQRLLGSAASAPRASATAVAPAIDSAAPAATYLQRTSPAAPDRRAEVTMFPSPAAAEPIPDAPAVSAAKEPPPAPPAAKPPVTFTPEQLLQALQGKLQLAAERAVDTALATRLDETVKQALGKIEEGWKGNVRQTEEFSAAHLAEVQKSWERELVVYRGRAEEISRRVEALAASSRQGLVELQKFAERIKNEVEPQFDARLNDSFTRAKADLEKKASELSEQHKTKINEFAQFAALQSRSQLEETVAEARSLVSAAKVPADTVVSDERLESLMNSARESTLNRMEERLADIWQQFERQQDLARHRADEIAQHLEMLTTQMNEAKAQHQQALTEVQSTLAAAGATASAEQLDSAVKLAKEHIFNHLEWRLGEVSGRADQQHNASKQQAEELVRRIDGLADDSANTRTQSERSAAELRALLANANSGISQQQFDSVLNSAREQLLNHFEWRLGEVSGQFQRHHEAALLRSEELAQRFDAVASEMRNEVDENRTQTENLIQELRPQDHLATLEQSIDRAAQEFEISATRISDRQLVRLLQQKQALSTEASLELEARASETRANLQKVANSTLDDFHRRVEGQVEQIVADSTERVASSLASLDAESRAACDARRREVELHVNRAAEQSMAEFRSGIKAFLYSCLVAAVSAVDEHAQSTLSALGKDGSATPPALEAREENERDSVNGRSAT
jgi:hypothetical protein